MTARIASLGMALSVAAALLLAGCDKPSTISQDLGTEQVGGAKLAVEQHGVFRPLDTVTWEIKSLDPSRHVQSMKGWVGLENGEGSKPIDARWNAERDAWVIDLLIPPSLPDNSKFWLEANIDGQTEKAAWNYEVTQR